MGLHQWERNKNAPLAYGPRIGLWSVCCLWLWTAKAHRLKKCLCGTYRFTNCGIGYELGECSNVLSNFFDLKWVHLCQSKLRRDIRHDQSRYWGREGRHFRLTWWFFQSKCRNERSGFVELNRPLALAHFRDAGRRHAKRLGDLVIFDPPLLKPVEQLPRSHHTAALP